MSDQVIWTLNANLAFLCCFFNFFTDIDDCNPDQCVNGVCNDAVNDYNCVCDPGYEGKNCDQGKSIISIIAFLFTCSGQMSCFGKKI